MHCRINYRERKKLTGSKFMSCGRQFKSFTSRKLKRFVLSKNDQIFGFGISFIPFILLEVKCTAKTENFPWFSVICSYLLS